MNMQTKLVLALMLLTNIKIYKMNKYDKDMMHERELIYDAKKQIHNEDIAKKKSMHPGTHKVLKHMN
jgi:hypothetical protein|tara:strand:- start:307 stop:507 length:201 start_codon:yes stop_codon:yes gene_type:complete